MRFAVTLHVDVPEDTDIDAYEMRGWFEEQIDEALGDSEAPFAVNVVSCEQIEDDGD